MFNRLHLHVNERKPLLILHGALGASAQFAPLLPLLAERFDAHTLDFHGHGGAPVADEPFGIDLFAAQVIDWIERNSPAGIDIFGYSMGGYVALTVAGKRPELVGRIFTLATKFRWDEAIAEREVGMLDPRRIEEKVPRFAEELKRRHAPLDWELMLSGTAELMRGLGRRNALAEEELQAIAHRVRVSIGDRDAMVTLDETIHTYRQLRNGELLVLPVTPHPIEKVPMVRLASELADFFC